MEKVVSIQKNWSSDIKQTYALIRDINDDENKTKLSYDYYFDPPNLAKFLDVFVDLEETNVHKLSSIIMNAYCEGQLEEAENNAKQLAKMIKGDPRLGKFLQKDFLKFLVDLLTNQQSPTLQFHAAAIIQHSVLYSTNNQVLEQSITPSIILNFVSSKDRELQLQAIKLLRAIALGLPNHPQINLILENTLDTLIPFTLSLLTDASPNREILHISTRSLAAVCLAHPMLSDEKFESVLLALKDLILYKGDVDVTEVILPRACTALAYLCDGRGAMVVKDDFLGEIIDRLIVLIDSDSSINCNSGLIALGRMVRWASDCHIQLMIEKGVLWSVEWMIRQDEKYCVMYSCWIISNITARKGNFIKDVIHCSGIGSLVDVVQNFKFLEPKREAAWAIINAIHGATIDQMELFKTSCVKALWNVLTVFSDNVDMVFACLEVLAKLEVVTVTCNTKLIDNVQFQKYLVTLQGRRFKLADEIDGFPKSKKLRTTDNLGKYDGDMEFLITCTSEEDLDLQQPGPPIISIRNGNIGHVSLDGANIAADEMEVEKPR
ncbi:hypothetical protein POM88_013189 [Heracleum sosnowskyi]|uniref:Importin subunit alpha n=1 Tax=Heracleum sosnowskyi TaxID=360622 RepID=A0AAD8IZE9_9APIA|nr:hypothetical protein POM88_013189 [Heracleum sosnowskyi]